MILPIILLTFLRLQYVLSTSNNSLIFGYSIRAENEFKGYQNSLTNLLGTLASQAKNPGFYNFTTTSPENPNQLHGLYLCRGDMDPETCQSCVNFAKNDVLKTFPYSRQGLVWYNHCMVRFSNESFWGKWDAKLWSSSRDIGKIKGSRIRFLRMLFLTMKHLATEASNGDNGNKFASKIANKFMSSLESLYAMVQCTPDLRASDCYRCLSNASQKLLGMRGSTSGQVFYSSCMAQYKTTTFAMADNKIKPLPIPTSPVETNSTLVISVRGTNHEADRSE